MTMDAQERWPALLVRLRADTWRRAVDLARDVGVSESTIYRDVQGLMEAGVPIEGVPGKGYRLPASYLTRPVRLTVDEAVMLVLGSAYAAQNFDGRYRAAARAAQRKLEDVLPSDAREQAFSLQGSAHLVPPSAFGNPTEDALLRRLRRALLEERRVELHREDDADSPRLLDPYGLVRRRSTWHLVGRNPSRGRVEFVRLDRVDRIRLTDATFDRPASYASRSSDAPPDRTVRVVFSAEVSPAVQVPPSLSVDEAERLPDGRLVMTIQTYHEVDVMPWLLSWGAHVRVLSPTALCEKLAAEARKVAAQYPDVPTLLDGAPSAASESTASRSSPDSRP